jgi:hypothetical protein
VARSTLARTPGGLIKTSIQFPPARLAFIERLAEERGVSRSVIVNEMVSEKEREANRTPTGTSTARANGAH